MSGHSAAQPAITLMQSRRRTQPSPINTLTQEINRALVDPKMVQQIAELGDTPLLLTVAVFEKLVAELHGEALNLGAIPSVPNRSSAEGMLSVCGRAVPSGAA